MLTGKEKRQLRATGNKLKPEIWIGKEGVSGGSLQALTNAFNTKELVKIKLQESCPVEKNEAARLISESLNAEVAQIVGNTILLYRPQSD